MAVVKSHNKKQQTYKIKSKYGKSILSAKVVIRLTIFSKP
jgi:hypothetical protein